MDRQQIKTRIRGGSVETPKKANKAKPAPKTPKKSAPKTRKTKEVKKVETPTPTPAADQGEPEV